jgi:hypothetical protein
MYVDAHQMHAAVDLSCNESGQLMYKTFPEGSRRVSPFLCSWEGDSHRLTRVWAIHGVRNSASVDASPFQGTNPCPVLCRFTGDILPRNRGGPGPGGYPPTERRGFDLRSVGAVGQRVHTSLG